MERIRKNFEILEKLNSWSLKIEWKIRKSTQKIRKLNLNIKLKTYIIRILKLEDLKWKNKIWRRFKTTLRGSYEIIRDCS